MMSSEQMLPNSKKDCQLCVLRPGANKKKIKELESEKTFDAMNIVHLEMLAKDRLLNCLHVTAENNALQKRLKKLEGKTLGK